MVMQKWKKIDTFRTYVLAFFYEWSALCNVRVMHRDFRFQFLQALQCVKAKLPRRSGKKLCFFLFVSQKNEINLISDPKKINYIGFCCSWASSENNSDAKDIHSHVISKPASFNFSAVSSLFKSKFWKKTTNMKLHRNFDNLQQWCQWEKHFFIWYLRLDPFPTV